MLEVQWQGERLGLHPEGALWWPARQALLVADLHLGKEQVFHASGIPVPPGGTERDLGRLSAVLEETNAASLVILGDLFHGRASHAPEVHAALGRWRDRHSALATVLVRGNHDRHAGDPPGWLGFDVRDPAMEAPPFLLLHEAGGTEALPTIEGHVHPAIRLRDTDGSGLRLPCYHLRPRRLVLPAFGGFTGGFDVTPRSGDRIFVVHEGLVAEVPLAPPPPPRRRTR